jgi:cytochrome P450
MTRNFPPGPQAHGLRGSFHRFNRDRLGFLREQIQYGEVSSAKFGPYPVFFANGPEAIHQVLVEDAPKYYKSSVTKTVMEPVVGQGLFTNDGDSWKRQRRLAQPAFHTKRIGAYADVMAQYADELADTLQDAQTVQFDQMMTALTMRVIAKTMFDADVSGDAKVVGEAVSRLLEIMNARFAVLFHIPLWVPIPSNFEMKRAIQTVDRVIQRFIDERRASGQDAGDLLSMLLLAQDEEGTGGMSDRQVRDEAITIFGAGHETTAVTLTWTTYLLSQHPEIEARLHEEWRRVLAGRTPTLADLPNLTFTEQVIKESMRILPPAWGTTRMPFAPTDLHGYTVSAGETVFINIYGVHHDPRFFPNPDTFDPDRFSPENEKLLPKYAYLPFGGGPRVCIGNAFAMMEAKLILATLGQRFRFSLAPDSRVVPETIFTLRPKYGLKMVAHERLQTDRSAVEHEAVFA